MSEFILRVCHKLLVRLKKRNAHRKICKINVTLSHADKYN